jgi:hypothetical protein
MEQSGLEFSYEVVAIALMCEGKCFEGDPRFAWTFKNRPTDEDIRQMVREGIPGVYTEIHKIQYRVGNSQPVQIDPI